MKTEEKQLTEQEAIQLYDNKFWLPMSEKERASFQLYQDRLCMPFDVFQDAMQSVLERPLWSHEFANRDALTKEFESKL